MLSEKPYLLHASIGYQLSKTARLQERGFETELKSLGLTRISWCILLAVHIESLRNPSAIADFVGIDRTATSRALTKMARDGLVERHEEQSDGRRASVQATKLGRIRLEKATQSARKNAAHFEAKLSGMEQEALRSLLLKLQSGEGSPLPNL
ncbi:MarR family winged helix-turn-helix transcriptional regulator [Falsihalocynthiibacter sp. BN13B15]|uniref:MarR family winged helix-turn-helix transcriptional regulator n=1 Tax=Falsihalocynthiibacter sp. BN13B15 TaxID=3240871 RepID=UPI003510A35D